MKIALLVLASLGLAGCGAKPMSEHKTDNPEITIDQIARFEGCRIFRFMDAGRYVYFLRCEGSPPEAVAVIPPRQYQSGKYSHTEYPIAPVIAMTLCIVSLVATLNDIDGERRKG